MKHRMEPGLRRWQQTGNSIEQGNFVLTMMPSLYCAFDCPHCYLSREERRDRTRLSDEGLARILRSVDAYYDRRGIERKTVHAYQYGGEPTSMGVEAFSAMLDVIDECLPARKGYRVRHTILTSLVDVDLDAWEGLIRNRCGGFVQTSYDGRMRGRRFVRKWEENARRFGERGIGLSTISVVNNRILEEGPRETLDFLCDLGVLEASFLPFMLNLANQGAKYERLAPTMANWSRFMIELTEYWIEKRVRGEHVPEIGQMRFVLAQAENPDPVSNIAGQTLFLLPNGDFALPDYDERGREYMRRFGNGLETDFAGILNSPERRAYLRRQVSRNGNAECIACPHADKCVMEFWKDNRPGDDCFGGRRYVEWLMENRRRIDELDAGIERTVSLY